MLRLWPPLYLDQRSVGRVLELKVGKMCERLGPEVGEHDPLRLELVAMRHHLLVRDVRWVVAVEVRGLADEEVGSLGDGGELLGPARIAGVRDELSSDLDAQAVR